MPTIELSQASFDMLKDIAEPLIDTPDTVIRRLLEAYQAGAQGDGGKPEATKNGRTAARRIVQRDGKRARKGERTRTEEFVAPLLKALKDGGGKLEAHEAIDRVGELMGDRLNEVDRSRLPSGEIRWRNTVRWAAQRLQVEGKLSKNAPYGFWKVGLA